MKLPLYPQRLLYLSLLLAFSASPGGTIAAVNVGFNWLSINFVWLNIFTHPHVDACVLLTFRWHLLSNVFIKKRLLFVGSIWICGLSAAGRPEIKNIWKRKFSTKQQLWLTASLSPLPLVLKKLHHLQLQPFSGFIIYHKNESWWDAGRAFWNCPPGVELHTVLTLWSP